MTLSKPAERPNRIGLSKSRLTALDQCERKLWLSVRKPEAGVLDPGAAQRFQAGHRIGEIACGLCPDGIMVEADPDLAAAVSVTRALVDAGTRRPLFEATFEHDGVLVRVDILTPEPGGGWMIAEVKSSTSVKDYHRSDLATQVWVLRQAGMDVRAAAIRHIDNQFVLRTASDYAGLFADTDCLGTLDDLIASREERVARARAVLAGDEPVTRTGDHCSAPFDCEFSAHCSAGEPPRPEYPISLLPRTGKKVAKTWAEKGVSDLRLVPRGALSGDLHQRIHDATLTGEAFHDVAAIVAATAGWAWPRAYLDFETIGLAAPRWLGTRPYQAVPFQFSCHIEERSGAVAHHGFLSIDGDDPRRACAEALVSLLGGDRVGAIITYNAAFERGCLRDLAVQFPDLADDLTALTEKVVDLLPVTRDHYYHPAQRGSWSIKAVLRAVVPEMAYDDLDVGDGTQAQAAWLEAVGLEPGHARRQALRTALGLYCARDTEAMLVLVRRLSSS